jgi:hypothetical protein
MKALEMEKTASRINPSVCCTTAENLFGAELF